MQENTAAQSVPPREPPQGRTSVRLPTFRCGKPSAPNAQQNQQARLRNAVIGAIGESGSEREIAGEPFSQFWLVSAAEIAAVVEPVEIAIGILAASTLAKHPCQRHC